MFQRVMNLPGSAVLVVSFVMAYGVMYYDKSIILEMTAC